MTRSQMAFIRGVRGTPRFLIHDRDPLFAAAFGEVFKAEGMRIITTLMDNRHLTKP